MTAGPGRDGARDTARRPRPLTRTQARAVIERLCLDVLRIMVRRAMH